MPETGTDGHVTLLIAEHLGGRIGALVAEDELRELVRGLARQHRSFWRRDARLPGAEAALVAGAVERLESLRLVRRENGGVRPLPALARYAIAAPTIAGMAA
jgi:uncharacterized protein (TIGR02678 family)